MLIVNLGCGMFDIILNLYVQNKFAKFSNTIDSIVYKIDLVKTKIARIADTILFITFALQKNSN